MRVSLHLGRLLSAHDSLDLIEKWRTTRDSGQWLNEEGQKVPL